MKRSHNRTTGASSTAEPKNSAVLEYLTRRELGEAVFQAAKAEIESRGFSLWQRGFDPDYPVSLRTLSNIRNGEFKTETLNKLPGIQVEERFCLKLKLAT